MGYGPSFDRFMFIAHFTPFKGIGNVKIIEIII